MYQVTKAVKRSKPGAVTTLVIYYSRSIHNYILIIIGAVHLNL